MSAKNKILTLQGQFNLHPLFHQQTIVPKLLFIPFPALIRQVTGRHPAPYSGYIPHFLRFFPAFSRMTAGKLPLHDMQPTVAINLFNRISVYQRKKHTFAIYESSKRLFMKQFIITALIACCFVHIGFSQEFPMQK
ncbi:hypothetical protein [uncultured Duncaniella sp.]|uniref:hypothetical protein n=1 Tax=uncultured Duncaniella sp. TaxID=2768039 RepID=UPI00272AEEBA|nr:hypothetical protein [uncultured Duncaniella sp.]